MKRTSITLIASTLVVAMAMALTSCGGNRNNDNSDGNVTNTNGVTTDAGTTKDNSIISTVEDVIPGTMDDEILDGSGSTSVSTSGTTSR